MRGLKKVIAIMIVFSMMGLSSLSVFAVNTEVGISVDAKICADIGILRGTNTNGVTVAYTQTYPTRIQAAIMFLRMKGLENTALAYRGTKNFKDYKSTYTSGRKVMAYLKANPTIGFVGYANGYFYPNRRITAQQFYKVILTALGYVQDKDYTYANVFSFAATKGISKLNANTDFTVDAMAVAIVEGLKATLKTGNSTLVEKLVAMGSLDAEAVATAGLIATPTPTPTPTLTPTPTPSPDPTMSPNPSEIFPLKVSSNGHYLTDINNNPYYVFADTGWMMFSYISKEQAETYLDSRKSHGVNTILCYAAPFYMDRPNAEGNLPFIEGDLTRPNDLYFDSVDWVINKAAEKDMQVIICPVELANYTDSGRNYGLNVDSALAIGRYMGNRYKNFRNIMWFTGGDTQPSEDQIAITNALAAGIREYDINHIMSYHPGGGSSSSMFFNDQFWLKYNMFQSYSPNSIAPYDLMLNDYNLVPIRPSILIEPCYEDNGSNSVFQVRRANAWGALSGGFGVTYGNQVIYNFGVNANPPFEAGRDLSSYWTPYLEHTGFLQVASLVEEIKSRAWYNLVPDQAHEVITGGYGGYGETDYAVTEISNTGSFSMSYIPTARAITIDMTQFNSSKTIKWYDMTINTYTSVGVFPNTGSVNLPAKPANSYGQYDWVLVIE
ncbi:MAG: DUF4038 domain-containing protein [Clostridia bacterium]|jgi:hypothetical protein